MPVSTPTVSIVVPSYQNARFIERTMESALAQTYPGIELCVADHSSTDGTWELLQQYADRPGVRLARTPAGGGAPANWQAVTEMATGDYVKLLCGDDLIAATCVARQVEALEAHPDAVLAASRRELVDVHDEVLLAGRGLAGLGAPVVPGNEAIRALVRAGTNLLGEPGCVLFRRSAMTGIGGWHSPYPYLIDQFTYMRLLEQGDLAVVPDTLASFRVSSTQWSVQLATEQARQAAGTHRYFHERHPDVVSSTDVRIGNLQALKTAWLRRLAYAAWRKRM
jgi:glycosyltransferase involved in cell wall biosynthesis